MPVVFVRWYSCRRPFPLSCLDIRYSVSDLDFPDFSEEHAKHRINAIINTSELEKNIKILTNFLCIKKNNSIFAFSF